MADIDDLIADIQAGPQGPEVGAFFDFDGTLIDGYSATLYFRDRLMRGRSARRSCSARPSRSSTCPHAGTT
ncbi:MAG: hypothetical protein R2731_07250 [Nocardioides sp.]